ncbi:MAG TPA: alanine--tRNA ligase-related protein, partial [bacterium]|nr:alanine--tRNA ligase-related protein [bacterium]
PRAASAQRCLRVSGKHNDLEEVGRTPRHHTLFEMLGNFSFGDYFKEGAIEFAWEFLTGHLKLDPSRLMFTVFGGEKGLAADEEAEMLWRKITGCGPERIQRFGAKDNFWSMGDVGPCGPCSEIHYDLGSDLPGKVNDGDRWMEIWNLVFMEFERDAKGTLHKLPAPSIDTGMGLERIASVVQGKRSNYEIDLFAELLRRISQITARPYDGGPGDDAVSMRVIADHARATAFLLADGVMPDRAGRGYVLRKVMRRAISHGVLLGVQHGFLADVAECVVELMGEAHPGLREKEPAIRRGAEAEEKLYRRTVEEGMRRIDALLQQLEDETIWEKGTHGTRVMKGDVAFRLYDTYGCPLELTASVGVRRGFSVDEAGFQAAMEVQKERSREHWKGAGGGRDAADAHFSPKRQEIGATRFVGYEDLEGDSQLRSLAIVHENELVPVEHAPEGSVV